MTSAAKPTVVLIEDDSSTQAALVRLLRTHYSVSVFASAEEAQTQLQSWGVPDGPDLILSDYTLPHMSGLEFLMFCREKYPDSVRILLTGHIVSDTLSAALREGVCHRIFLKPWENDVLLLQIQEALQQRSLLKSSRVHEQRSSVDGLTGLFNVRFFQDTFLKEMDRACRHGRPLCLILLDLDQFKHINDLHGHAAGNRALILVAEVLQQSLRAIDLSARFGGDEFALILPDTAGPGGKDVAERIRHRVATRAKEEALELTLSLGVGVWSPQVVKASTEQLKTYCERFFECTDQALYQAKSKGRNQTIVAEFALSPL